jgi:hypothetical protein
LLKHAFSNNSVLSRIQGHIHQLDTIHALLLTILPSTLRPHCHSVYWMQKTLVANITNTAALSKIRQLSPSILINLQQKELPLTEFKAVILMPSTAILNKKTQKMTPAALAAFQTLENSVSDNELKKAITKLIQSHRNN